MIKKEFISIKIRFLSDITIVIEDIEWFELQDDIIGSYILCIKHNGNIYDEFEVKRIMFFSIELRSSITW